MVLGALSYLQDFLRPFAGLEIVSPFPVDWVWSAKKMVKVRHQAKRPSTVNSSHFAFRKLCTRISRKNL
ncbi:MAG: hypothetical protein RMK94_04475 [Armatimonadota bacterium]|nr:hypothetical protein [Armatimonadota bacterium]